MTDYYSKTTDEVLAELNTSGQGLTGEEAELRLAKYGENRLHEKKKKTRINPFLQNSQTLLVILKLLLLQCQKTKSPAGLSILPDVPRM